MPQRTMQAVESIFYDNFIALIERPRTASTNGTINTSDQIKSVVSDTDKNVTSKFYTTALQSLQLARLKRIPHYARLVAFTNLYKNAPVKGTNSSPSSNSGISCQPTAGGSTASEGGSHAHPQSTVHHTEATEAAPQDPPQKPLPVDPQNTEPNGAPQIARLKCDFSKPASPKPSKKTIGSGSVTCSKRNEDPDELAFLERVDSIVVTDRDAFEFTHQLDMARLIFSKLIANDTFKDIIYTSSAAQKAFLYLLVPIIFKPEETGIVADFINVLKDEDDLLDAACLDGNRASIERVLMGTDLLYMGTSTPDKDILEDVGERESLENKLSDILDDNIDYDSPILDGSLDDMCIVCQFRKTYKRSPKHFIAAYNKSMEEERKNRGASCDQHLQYYRMLYALSLSLRVYWNMLDTHPLEEVRLFISQSFGTVNGSKGEASGSENRSPSTDTGGAEEDDVLSAFPGHYADHSSLSATAET